MSFWTKFKRRTRSQEKTAAAAITSLADLVITEEEKTAAASNATSTTVGVTDDIIEDSNGRQFTINEKGVWQKVRSDAQVADPTGQSGKYLTTDGVNTSWGTIDMSSKLDVGAKAADSNLLDGLDSSQFLGVSAKAADSNLLDGLNSTQFLRSDTTDTFSGTLNVHGDIYLTGPATTSNQNRQIVFPAFDKEGTTDPSDTAFIRHTTNVGNSSGSVLMFSSQNDSNDGFYFSANGSSRAHFQCQISSSNNVTSYYSDERLKTKTGNIENALDKVESLDAFYYVENELARELGYTNEEQQVALSAQDVQKVMPEVVTLAPVDSIINEDGKLVSKSGENYLTVDYAKMVPLLVQAIKELKAEIDELKGSK